ncbi:rhs element Vgr family protein, partial [Escherichia coli 93.0056]
RKNR